MTETVTLRFPGFPPVRVAGPVITAIEWDEPAGASSPRGWLMNDGTAVGFYLDYGPDHYRSPHKYCSPERLCPDCQPGNVLAVRYPGGPGSELARASRYVETVSEARRFVETGHV